jgi:NADPH:quinone reductase-like Zn-dependent oxidoreductase
MRALVFERPGDPAAVLKLAYVADPTPAEGHALVKVTARPIHPADRAFIRGEYRIQPRLPQVAGLEGAGIVIHAGEVSRFPPGTRVAFRWPGTWAELMAVPESRLTEVPPGAPDEAACQISLNPVTAWALLDEGRLQQGDWLLLTAAGSTVSRLIAAMARQRGIAVIGIVRDDSTRRGLSPSTTCFLSARDTRLGAQISAIAGEHGVAALLDSVGGPLLPTLFATLRPGARIVSYGAQDREPSSISNGMLIYSLLTWIGFGIDRWLSRLAEDSRRDMFARLWSMVLDGTLALPVASKHGLEDFAVALAADAQKHRRGKVLLT